MDSLEQRVVLNADPIANGDEFESFYQQSASFSAAQLLANDEDSDYDTLSVVSVDSTSAEGGTITWNSGTNKWDYEAPDEFSGLDTFEYEISDGNGGFDTGTITVDVAPPSAPGVEATSAWVEGTELHIIFEGWDADGESLTFSYDDGNGPYGTGSYIHGGYIHQEWVGEINALVMNLVVTVTDGDALEGYAYEGWEIRFNYNYYYPLTYDGNGLNVLNSTVDFDGPLGGLEFDPSLFASVELYGASTYGLGDPSVAEDGEVGFSPNRMGEIQDEFFVVVTSKIGDPYSLGGMVEVNVVLSTPGNTFEAGDGQTSEDCDCGCNNCEGMPKTNETTGELRLKHTLTDAVKLIYNSLAEAAPIVQAVMQITEELPETIGVEMTFNGVTQDPVYFEKGEFEEGEFADLGLVADTAELASGLYDWSVRMFDPSDDSTLRELSGQKPVINTTQEGLSSGWSIGGINRLVIEMEDAFLIQPDGDWSSFRNDGFGTYTTLDGFGTLEAITGGYRWTKEDGTYEEFNESGYLQQRVEWQHDVLHLGRRIDDRN